MFDIPFLDIAPLRAVAGSVRLPGSKSISNRVLLLAALCQGRTVVHDLLDSDDTQVMLRALDQLGCGVAVDGSRAVIDGDLVFVSGTTGYDYATMVLPEDAAVLLELQPASRPSAAAPLPAAAMLRRKLRREILLFIWLPLFFFCTGLV